MKKKDLVPPKQIIDNFIYINDDALSLEMCVKLYNHVWKIKIRFRIIL